MSHYHLYSQIVVFDWLFSAIYSFKTETGQSNATEDQTHNPTNQYTGNSIKSRWLMLIMAVQEMVCSWLFSCYLMVKRCILPLLTIPSTILLTSLLTLINQRLVGTGNTPSIPRGSQGLHLSATRSRVPLDAAPGWSSGDSRGAQGTNRWGAGRMAEPWCTTWGSRGGEIDLGNPYFLRGLKQLG